MAISMKLIKMWAERVQPELEAAYALPPKASIIDTDPPCKSTGKAPDSTWHHQSAIPLVIAAK